MDRPLDRVTSVLTLATAWLLPTVGLALVRWRPSSRSGFLAILLGSVWSVWTALAASGGASLGWSVAVVMLVRPVTYWLLLSWPSGRLQRSDARWLSAYALAEVLLFATVPFLLSSEYPLTDIENPVSVAESARALSIADSLTTMLVLPLGAAVLVIALARRYRRLPPTAAYLAAPVVVAGVLIAAWDLLLPVTSQMNSVLLNDSGNWTVAGTVFVITDVIRFTLLPILLGLSALRIRRLTTSTSRIRRLDLTERASPTGLAAAAARGFGNEQVQVAFSATDGSWLDQHGRPTELGGEDMVVTTIERSDSSIAALEFPRDEPQRQVLVESVVAAAGAALEVERLEALAHSRRHQAARARRALLEVGDDTTRRTQQDLHDGAQQRLVGLMLHTRLAAASEPESSDAVAAELNEGINVARSELRSLVDQGAAATQNRRLDQAIEGLAATIPIPTSIELQLPTELSAQVRSVAWFVAAEATTNAVKHSEASCLEISGSADNGRLVLSVSDDGKGGAQSASGTGIAGIRQRVERLGGRLTVESTAGIGTRVVAELPVGVGQ